MFCEFLGDTVDPTASPTTSPTATPTTIAPTAFPTASPTISPPELQSAQFSNNGRHIYVQFTSETDRAETVLSSTSGTFTCSLLLTFPGSTSAQCLWTDLSSIRVTLQSTTVFAHVNDLLSLKSGVVKARCTITAAECSNYLFAAPIDVPISSPSSPVLPIFVINTADTVSRCGDISLDTTASTGKGNAPWVELLWEVSSDTSNPTSAVESWLNSATSFVTGVFTISNSMLLNGSYTFRLCGQNMFAKTSCSTSAVEVDVNKNAPTVGLSGPTSILRYEKIAILGTAFVPACDGGPSSYAGLTFTYQLYKNVSASVLEAVSLSSVSKKPRDYKLNEYQLDVNTDYVLQLTVMTTSGASRLITHEFSVGRAGARAIIAQGFFTTVYESSTVILDGSSSYDLDFPTATNDLEYRWGCVEYEPNLNALCDVISNAGLDTFSPTSSISLSATLFTVSYKYLISLYVKNVAVGGGTDSATTIVSIQAGKVIPIATFTSFKPKYNRHERLFLKAGITTGSSFQSSVAKWSAFDSSGVQLNLQSIVLTDLTKTLSPGVTPFDITVDKNTLEAGASYTFRVTATYYPDETDVLAETQSDIQVFMNGPPAGGTFEITPLSGQALRDIFLLFSSSWDDDVDDYPLLYLFKCYTTDPAQSYLVRDYESVSYMTAYLGEGPSHLSNAVVCVSNIQDVWGSFASDSVTVTVSAAQNVLQSVYTLKNLTEGLISAGYRVICDELMFIWLYR